jgi:hypothetical protein
MSSVHRSTCAPNIALEVTLCVEHACVAGPHYGGHIERLIGTMMGKVHLRFSGNQKTVGFQFGLRKCHAKA